MGWSSIVQDATIDAQKCSTNVSVPAFGNKGNDILFDEDAEVCYQPSLLLVE